MPATVGLIVALMVLAIAAAGLWLYRRFDKQTPANPPDYRPGTPGDDPAKDIGEDRTDFRKRA